MSDGYEDLENEEYEDFDDAPSLGYESPQRDTTSGKPPRLSKKGSTTFVTIDDIKQLIPKKCEEIIEVLGIPDDEAILLCAYYRWRKDLVESEYFENPEKIRKKAGIDPENAVPLPTDSEITCPLCFDTKPKSEFDGLKCNHLLCKDCWLEYIEYNVTRPENLFFWKCPSQGCSLIVPDSFNKKYLKSDQEAGYNKKMAVAYADTSNSMRWCPAPNCYYGSEVESVFAKCVECPCGWMYCFKCGIEDHRPCDCVMAQEWSKRDQSGGANAKWLLVNTKDCPKCRKPIEKNQGCNYMRCQHPGCHHEFCWLCLSDWSTHSSHFKCNKFDNLSQEEKLKMNDDEQKKRSDLQKYAFYYERYLNNAQAIESITKLMQNIKAEEKNLSYSLSLTLTQLEFLENACQVLRNSKRSLKWSYAYGFYLNNDLQRNLYEIIQEKMDIYSSELHVLLEKEFPIARQNISDFTVFKDKVLAAIFKCKQSAQTFLEKMEEFETVVMEEQMASLDKGDKEPLKRSRTRTSKRGKRMASNVSDDTPGVEHETQRVRTTNNEDNEEVS